MRHADAVLHRSPQPFRWLTARLWRIEHAFERAKAAGKAEDDTHLRMAVILAIFAIGFLVLAAKATRGALFSDADKIGLAAEQPLGDRADLTDRNGQLLAVDLPHFGLYFDPHENWDVEEVRRDLTAANLPNLSADRLDKALHADKRQYLVGGLTPDQKDAIDDLGLPGVSFEPEAKRVYPMGPTAAHLIGFVDKGGVGLAGAEHALDKTMRADPGAPAPLAIDVRVQAALQDELAKAAINFRAVGGVGIVTNVRTGEILGMASFPGYDPNKLSETNANAMLDRVAAARYEPGSVFKVFTVAMGLDSGVATLDTLFDARSALTLEGRKTAIHDFDKDNAYLPLWEVFTHSSNIGAARLGILAGKDRMNKYFKAFGLYDAAPSELAESARPLLPRTMDDSTIASVSFGQGIAVSPLAIAAGMGSILNGGTYVPLTIRKLDPSQYPTGRRVISENTSRQMLDLMRRNAVEGTGRSADAQAPGYRLGGKTGTAQKPVGGRYDATKKVSSFAGVFPTDGPLTADRYFVLIMLDEPQGTKETGGWATGAMVAAPSVGRVVERIAPYLRVARAPINPQSAKLTLTPDQLSGGER